MLQGSAPGAAPAAPRTGTQAVARRGGWAPADDQGNHGDRRAVSAPLILGSGATTSTRIGEVAQGSVQAAVVRGACHHDRLPAPLREATKSCCGSRTGATTFCAMSGKRQTAIDDPEHWRRRASETRALAVAERKLWVKLRLERIAKSYEKVAALTEAEASQRVNKSRSEPIAPGKPFPAGVGKLHRSRSSCWLNASAAGSRASCPSIRLGGKGVLGAKPTGIGTSFSSGCD